MNVVAARVHDTDLGSISFRDFFCGRIRLIGFFSHRQPVQVGSHHDGRARAVFNDANDSISSDVSRYRCANGLQFAGNPGSRFLFLKRKLGVAMQLNVQLH